MYSDGDWTAMAFWEVIVQFEMKRHVSWISLAKIASVVHRLSDAHLSQHRFEPLRDTNGSQNGDFGTNG
jgi:hypothetical protein